MQEVLHAYTGTVNNLNKSLIMAMDIVYREENPSPMGGHWRTIQIDETIVIKGKKSSVHQKSNTKNLKMVSRSSEVRTKTIHITSS